MQGTTLARRPRPSRETDGGPAASVFSGVWTLTRLAIRHDRIRLPAWLAGLAAALTAWASSVKSLYPADADRAGQARVFADSLAARAIDGAVSGSSPGSIVMAEVFATMAVPVALVSTFAVVRHTRRAEEDGRAELIGAAPVGRHAGLAAALLLTVPANALFAVLTTAGLAVIGLPVAGSLAAGLGLGAIGIAFAAVAAVAAQFPPTARGANLLAGTAVGAGFALRALGDVAGETDGTGMRLNSAWPSWLSPIGWGQRIRPYDQDLLWVLVLFAVFAAAAAAAAAALAARRDFGAGLLPARPARATAPRSLGGPMGLAWRVQRGNFTVWAAVVVVLGAAFGGIGAEAEHIMRTSGQLRDIADRLGGAPPVRVWFTVHTGLTVAIAVARYTVQGLQRMRAEEAGGRLELTLATGVGRGRWMACHLAWVLSGTVLLLILAAVSASVSYGAASGDGAAESGAILTGALVQLPAELALAGLVIAVYGLAGSGSRVAIWAVFVVCVLLGPLCEFSGVPQPLLDLSPFTHVPDAPARDVAVTPLVILVCVAALGTMIGFAAFRRRDLIPPPGPR